MNKRVSTETIRYVVGVYNPDNFHIDGIVYEDGVETEGLCYGLTMNGEIL